MTVPLIKAPSPGASRVHSTLNRTVTLCCGEGYSTAVTLLFLVWLWFLGQIVRLGMRKRENIAEEESRQWLTSGNRSSKAEAVINQKPQEKSKEHKFWIRTKKGLNSGSGTLSLLLFWKHISAYSPACMTFLARSPVSWHWPHSPPSSCHTSTVSSHIITGDGWVWLREMIWERKIIFTNLTTVFLKLFYFVILLLINHMLSLIHKSIKAMYIQGGKIHYTQGLLLFPISGMC